MIGCPNGRTAPREVSTTMPRPTPHGRKAAKAPGFKPAKKGPKGFKADGAAKNRWSDDKRAAYGKGPRKQWEPREDRSSRDDRAPRRDDRTDRAPREAGYERRADYPTDAPRRAVCHHSKAPGPHRRRHAGLLSRRSALHRCHRCP